MSTEPPPDGPTPPLASLPCLRTHAEERLAGLLAGRPAGQGGQGGVPTDDIDIRRILHEMDVNNIERDMQLEELQARLAEAEKALQAQAAGSALQALQALQEAHQTEMQAQIEELRHSRREIEAEMRRYVELYDFAPTGYLTLDRAGEIRQANLAAAELLGLPRGNLVGLGFATLSPSPQPSPSRGEGAKEAADGAAFPNFLARVFRFQLTERCEVGLRRQGGRPPRHARLDVRVDPSRQPCPPLPSPPPPGGRGLRRRSWTSASAGTCGTCGGRRPWSRIRSCRGRGYRGLRCSKCLGTARRSARGSPGPRRRSPGRPPPGADRSAAPPARR